MKGTIFLIVWIGISAALSNSYPFEDSAEDYKEYVTPVSDDANNNDTAEPSPPTPSLGLFSLNNTEEFEPYIAPAEVPEEVLDIDSLKNLVYEFTNSTNGLQTADLTKQLESISEKLQASTLRIKEQLVKDEVKVGQLVSLISKVNNLREQFYGIDSQLQSLTQEAENLGKIYSSGIHTGNTSSGYHKAWATLYQYIGHQGRTTTLDFRSCLKVLDCCENLSELKYDTQSIDSHDSCVEMYFDRDCRGTSRQFYPGSAYDHSDFGSHTDRYISGKPCNFGFP